MQLRRRLDEKPTSERHLPLPPAVLHQAISQAFVDSIHGTFLISAIGLLVAALLVAFLFPSKQRATKMSVESVGLREAAESLATQSVVEEKVTG